MISRNLLVREYAQISTLDTSVHRQSMDGPVSIHQGRAQESSIRVCVYRPSSARIRHFSQLAGFGHDGAPIIPVRKKEGSA